MKKLLLVSIAISTASICAAQFTAEDFPREAEFEDHFILSSSLFDLPEHGVGLTWDFSAAVTDEAFSNFYMDATNDPFFENALTYRQRDLNFQGYLIESNEYESVDADTYSVLGRSITDVVYSITGITGGADDELRFVGGNYLYGGSYDNLIFPFEYQDTWTIDYEQNIDFELTVTGFGLNAAPGTQKRYFNQTREVVGEGLFIIPDENGDPSDPIEGMLIHVVRTAIDSVFLAGSPAPAPLMGAFGLTQGATMEDSFYVAYAYGFGAPMLSIDILGNQTGNLVYRPAAAEIDQTVAIHENEQGTLDIYPNPSIAGQVLNIRADVNQRISTVQFFSLTGQKVHEVAVNGADVATGIMIAVPNALTSGMYFVGLQNVDGEIIELSKMSIK